MRKNTYNGNMPKEFIERIKVLAENAMKDETIKGIIGRVSNEAKADTLARIILAAI